MDSVRGTVVVAGQTVGATAIVLPAWWYSFDVVHWTASGTETAKDALLSVHPELLVSNQVLVVVAANHVGESKGNGSLDQLLDIACFLCDKVGDMRHPLLSGSNLALLRLLGIEVEERETDVRLWHDNGKGSIQRETVALQLLSQNAHGVAHIVAASGQRIDVVNVLKRRSAQKFANDMRWLPAVSREANAQPLVVGQRIVKCALSQFVGNKAQSVASSTG